MDSDPFYAFLEASRFATHWLPFCKIFNMEPRVPEVYFAEKSEPHNDRHICSYVVHIRALAVVALMWLISLDFMHVFPSQQRKVKGTQWKSGQQYFFPGFSQTLADVPLQINNKANSNKPEQLNKIFELCGAPNKENWPGVSRIPWYNNFKLTRPLKRRVWEFFKHFEGHALELLDKMLALDPSQACGLVKNLVLIVYVTTVGSAANPILEFLEEWSTENFEKISPAVIDQAIKFFVNGCWVGIHRSPDLLVKTLRQLRRQVLFSILGNFGLSLTN
ncbi:hypothetical protein GIB67_018278 [Kingdonia uniflora]|uniref:DNA-directed RNA polymerase n=1 Tax=Kingdonia uniflora TaxID=39325 RepID=A0A7J7LF47_9MAGN|nr:hypothetical protein GIB67_018278 [Kingdonia uniflora]